MSPNPTERRYEFYRKLPFDAPSLVSSFQNLDQSPNDPRSHFELGEAAFQAGLLDLSVDCFVTVTELAPHVEAGFFNLGNAYFELKQFGKAKQAYQQAIVLNPECGTYNNLGNTLAAMEDWQNAIEAFDRALYLPASPAQIHTTLSNRGKALIGATDWDGAIENYRQAVLQFPKDVQFLALKAKCHRQSFEFGEAIKCLIEALEASPNNPELLCEISHVNFCRGRSLESLLCLNQAFSMFTPPANLHSRWLQMLSFCEPASPDRLLSEASQWAASVVQTHDQAISNPSLPAEVKNASPDKPLRVGILCQALQNRGLLDWLPDCLSKCDGAKTEWILFCDAALRADVENAIVRNGCKLQVTSRLSDNALATLISSQQITVVIDMIGHGLSTRLRVVADRPAPVQVSWCAFPMTSGLPQMDFIWSDQIAIPPHSENFFSEQVVRFPTSSFCFRPSCPIDLQLPNNSSALPFRCGFLGKPEQLSEPLIEAMLSMLVSIDDAELVFIGLDYRDGAFQLELREKFGKIPELSSRIRFECFDSDEVELNSYQQLDVTLDSFVVSSPQRSFESLWMGIPVVTLLGNKLSARSTASILYSLGRGDWVAGTQVEYVNAVKRLADSRSHWRAQRAQLRAELLASPMCNTTAIARNIQNAIDQSLHLSQFATTPN
jgi:protein O-GlcNAc transferase